MSATGLFAYGFLYQFFGVCQSVCHFVKTDAAAGDEGARIGIGGAYFAVRFGNEDAQGQLQGEGGVFDHQRRAGFGRAEDDDFCRLHR